MGRRKFGYDQQSVLSRSMTDLDSLTILAMMYAFVKFHDSRSFDL